MAELRCPFPTSTPSGRRACSSSPSRSPEGGAGKGSPIAVASSRPRRCPGINCVTLLDTEGRVARRVLEREAVSLSPLLGLRGTWFRRQDGQTVPNDPMLRIGSFSTEPWGGLSLGIRASF
jgi:hypothetical protein